MAFHHKIGLEPDCLRIPDPWFILDPALALEVSGAFKNVDSQ